MGKSKDLATGETRFVNTSGDTMTGDLTISSTAGQLKLTDTDGTEQNTTIKQSGGNVFIQARDNTNNAGIVFAGNGGGNYSEHMRINASGIVTKPNQPAFAARAYSGTTTQIAGYNPILWANVHTNYGNCFNNSNGKFTFPVSGRYYYECNINLKSSDNSWLGLFFIYNSNAQHNSWSRDKPNTDYNDTIVSGVVDAAANDFIFFGWHPSYVAPSTSSTYNYASIHLIG